MYHCNIHGKNNSHNTEQCKVKRSRKRITNKQNDNSQIQKFDDKNDNKDDNKDDNKSLQHINKRKANSNRNKHRNKNKKPKNTTEFNPCFDPPTLRLRFFQPSIVGNVLKDELTVHDVCYVPSLFCNEDDTSLYSTIINEIRDSSPKKDELFIEWHGDSHVIANDRAGGNWKEKCSTILSIIKKMEEFFDFTTNATRVNWYRPGSNDWKPYHHDRAAFTPGEPQNFTIAASLGRTREVGFEHAKKGTKIFIPVANGSAYTFCRDVNIEWKHGVIPTKISSELGRISIIAWGIRKQNTSESRITTNDVPTAQELGIKT